jgi:transcriptional regulator with XRE-family HTH domain
MSLRELERRSGVNRALLSRFERGLATPQRHELRLLEAALELEPGELQPRIVLMLDVEPGRLPLLFEPRDEEGS